MKKTRDDLVYPELSYKIVGILFEVLEVKRREYFSKNDIDQVYAYLKATGLKLGIIAHFTRGGVKTKRIINIRDKINSYVSIN